MCVCIYESTECVYGIKGLKGYTLNVDGVRSGEEKNMKVKEN